MVHFASSPPPSFSPFHFSHHHPQSITHLQVRIYHRQPVFSKGHRIISVSLAYIHPHRHPQWPPSAPPRPAFSSPLALPPYPLSSAALMQPSNPSPTLVKPCLPLNGLSPQNTPPPSTSPLNLRRPEQRPSTSTAGRLIRPPRSPRCNLTHWI